MLVYEKRGSRAALKAGDLPCDQMRCTCSAVLAHLVLKERLNIFGILGCILCIVGSITIVLHAPEEQPITSLLQVWRLALQPGKKSLPSLRLLAGLQKYKPRICLLQMYNQHPISTSLKGFERQLAHGKYACLCQNPESLLNEVACCAGFLLYCITAMGVILYLIFSVAPKHGNSNIFVYLAICSLIGSLSVMSVKASLLDFCLPKHMT